MHILSGANLTPAEDGGAGFMSYDRPCSEVGFLRYYPDVQSAPAAATTCMEIDLAAACSGTSVDTSMLVLHEGDKAL